MKTAKRQSFQARLDLENHQWLKVVALQEDRSANWVLNKLVTDARLTKERINVHPQQA